MTRPFLPAIVPFRAAQTFSALWPFSIPAAVHIPALLTSLFASFLTGRRTFSIIAFGAVHSFCGRSIFRAAVVRTAAFIPRGPVGGFFVPSFLGRRWWPIFVARRAGVRVLG
jgi:hypothetical protein